MDDEPHTWSKPSLQARSQGARFRTPHSLNHASSRCCRLWTPTQQQTKSLHIFRTLAMSPHEPLSLRRYSNYCHLPSTSQSCRLRTAWKAPLRKQHQAYLSQLCSVTVIGRAAAVSLRHGECPCLRSWGAGECSAPPSPARSSCAPRAAWLHSALRDTAMRCACPAVL
jgi:hypothetical protein